MGATLANPQVENGYIRIANEIWDALVAIRISGEARQVLDLIIRKTWGWGKKTDKISLSQLCDATGLKKSSVIKARKKLVKMNIITMTKKVNEITPSYGIVKDHTKWKPVPKKLTEPKSKTRVTKKVNKGVPKKLPTKDNKKDTITKDKIIGIFEFWNSKEIIVHRDIDGCSGEINARLQFYSVEEIKESIENYEKILHSEEYVFSYPWPLNDFLGRKKDNVARFLNSSKPFESFQKKEKNRNPFEDEE